MSARSATLCGLCLLGCLAVTPGCATERGTTETRMGSDTQWHGRIYRGTAGVEGEQDEVATATMTRLSMGTGDNVRASLAGRGGLAAGSYPWHVHAGTCGSDGAIIGPADEYPPFDAGGAGMGNVTADFNGNVSPDAQYYVNIHRSADDLTVIACGNLERGEAG